MQIRHGSQAPQMLIWYRALDSNSPLPVGPAQQEVQRHPEGDWHEDEGIAIAPVQSKLPLVNDIKHMSTELIALLRLNWAK